MAVLRKLWRLFVDDQWLAGLIVAWLAAVSALGLPAPWLFVGLALVLVWSAWRGGR